MTKDMDEVVMHIQGIIWRHDLPPFRNHAMYVFYLLCDDATNQCWT